MDFSGLRILLEQERSKAAKSNTYKAKAYSSVIKIIKDGFLPYDMVTIEKLNTLKLTDHMKNKIMKWVAKGRKPKMSLLRSLTHIMGIGESKAKKLIKNGLRSLRELKNKKWDSYLGAATKAYLKTKPNEYIPNSEIARLEKSMHSFSSYKWYITGSYRRGAKYSSDIDIMLVTDSGDGLDAFKDLKQFLEVFSKGDIHGYASGSKKMSMIINMGPKTGYAKIDVFVCAQESEYTMLSYSTGSKHTVVNMRSRLKKKGYKLDQYHLWDIRDAKHPISVPIESERRLFEIADMKYLEPHER